MQSIQQVRIKARKQCKDSIISAMKRLDDSLLSQPEPVALFEPTLGVSKQEIMEHFMSFLEAKLFEKYPMVDANYQRKVTDICANIK
jgi:hypothetical protein